MTRTHTVIDADTKDTHIREKRSSSPLLNLILQRGPLSIIAKHLTDKDLTSLTSHSHPLKKDLWIELEERRLLKPLQIFLLHDDIQKFKTADTKTKKDEKTASAGAAANQPDTLQFPQATELNNFFAEKTLPHIRLQKILQLIENPLVHYLKQTQQQFTQWNAAQFHPIPEPIILLFKSKVLQDSLKTQLPECYSLLNEIKYLILDSIRILVSRGQLSPSEAIEKLNKAGGINVTNRDGLTFLEILTLAEEPCVHRIIPLISSHPFIASDSYRAAHLMAFENVNMANALIAAHNTSPSSTALINTIKKGSLRLTVALLAKGARLNDTKAQLPSLVKDLPEDYRELATLIVTNGMNIDTPNAKGQTSLMLAIKMHNYYLAQTLIQFGASLHRADNEGNTPLMYAMNTTANANPYFASQLLKLLMENGASIDRHNFSNQTVFDMSAPYPELTKILLSYKKPKPMASTNYGSLLKNYYQTNKFGHNPHLMYALNSDNKSVVPDSKFASFKL